MGFQLTKILEERPKFERVEGVEVSQNAPLIRDPAGREGDDANPLRRTQLAQASSSSPAGLVFEFPAPGCPKKLPTYESASPICKALDKEACDRNRLCTWLEDSKYGLADCSPKTGSYLHPPPFDPADAARLGIDIGTLELEAILASAVPYEAKGDHYAAQGKYRKAIAEYTRALKEQPDLASALMGRASAYERVGDKAHAVRDYCEALANSHRFERYNTAKARIALLTGQPAAASPSASAANPPVSLPSDLRPAKPPPTSAIERSRRRNAIAPLAIESETGTNYLIKLVRVDGKDTILIFVRGGETYSTKIPLGTYNIRAAAGSTWYGRKDFFGPSTRFFRLRTKDGKQVNFTFSRKGNMIHGMRFQLMKVIEGNTEEETISRDEF